MKSLISMSKNVGKVTNSFASCKVSKLWLLIEWNVCIVRMVLFNNLKEAYIS